jgi:hypothetical protein
MLTRAPALPRQGGAGVWLATGWSGEDWHLRQLLFWGRTVRALKDRKAFKTCLQGLRSKKKLACKNLLSQIFF